jgi:hypothetical protein
MQYVIAMIYCIPSGYIYCVIYIYISTQNDRLAFSLLYISAYYASVALPETPYISE